MCKRPMNEVTKEEANGMEGKGVKFERKGVDEWGNSIYTHLL